MASNHATRVQIPYRALTGDTMGLLRLIGKLLNANFLEDENKMLRKELEQANDEYSDLLHEYGIVSAKLAKVYRALEE